MICWNLNRVSYDIVFFYMILIENERIRIERLKMLIEFVSILVECVLILIGFVGILLEVVRNSNEFLTILI